MAGVVRSNGSAISEVLHPPEPLCNPRLREAAASLAVMRG